MRKFYFFVALFFIALTSGAQISKQSVLAGGQLFYYNEKTKDADLTKKSTSGAYGISLGKAFKENSVVGFSFSYSPVKRTNYLNGYDTVALNYKQYDIGVFFREYKNLAKDFYFFGQVDGAFITANQTENYKVAAAEVNSSKRGGFISLTPGISYQVFKKMQLELTIPNILSMQYLVTKIDSQVPQVKTSEREEIMFYSNLNNNTSLSWLGVGFRFIL